MTEHVRDRRRSVVLSVIAAGFVVVACEADLVGTGGEPNVASMRVTVSSQQITVDQSGNVTGGPGVLHTGTVASVSAVFLDANGQSAQGVTPATYQLNVSVPGGQSITFQRSTTNPFAGTLIGSVDGTSTQLRFSLYNVETQQDVWGPFDVAFVVNN